LSGTKYPEKSYCELAALKPSAGRIPHRGYSGGTNSTIGPMANTMVDCAKIYSIIAGPDLDEMSRHSWYQPVVSVPKTILKSVASIKIGVDYDWIEKADSTILALFKDSLKKLERDGAQIVPITIIDPDNRDAAHPLCFVSEMLPAVNDLLHQRSSALSLEILCMMQASSSVKAYQYCMANRLRTKFIEAFEKLFEQIDLIATPATAMGTCKISETDKKYGLINLKISHLASYFLRICNFTGLPAVATPMGLDSNKMPVGIQFISKWWDEEKLLNIGMYWEKYFERNKPDYYLENKLI